MPQIADSAATASTFRPAAASPAAPVSPLRVFAPSCENAVRETMSVLPLVPTFFWVSPLRACCLVGARERNDSGENNFFNRKMAVVGEVLREEVAAAALGGFVKAHLLVRRTKPTSADAPTASARRSDSIAVFGFNTNGLVVPTEEIK